MATSRILAATDAIYDAAAGGVPWTEVGTALMGLTRARSISLMLGDAPGGGSEMLRHAGIPEEAVQVYRAHYRHVDLWTNRAARLLAGPRAGVPRVLASGEMLVPDAEFLGSEFYCDFGRRHGLRYVVGAVVPLGEAGVLPIGLHRPEGRDRFGAVEKRVLEAVLPHLRRALQLRLTRAPWLGANGPGGGPARTRAVPGDARDREALRALVRATASGGAGGAVRLRDGDGVAQLAALVAPLPRRLSGHGDGAGGRVAGRALVLLRPLQPGPPAPSAALLRDLFGLTRTEAEVAVGLTGGATKGAVAAARGLAETTVRSHVRALLEKTGAANLRELERLLAGL